MDEILADARAYATEHGFELVCNDRFFASNPDFVTFEYDVPAVGPDQPWELCRGLGYSFCVNRNERVEDHLSAREIVAMLVETVAKGGNLLLNVGPNADGTLPEIQEKVLRDSGAWVRAHADAIHGSTPFDIPGDGKQWYTRTGDVVHAFDLSSAPEPRFDGLHGVTRVTTTAGEELPFRENDRSVTVDARAVDRHPLGMRYEVSCDPRRPIGVSPVAKTAGIGPRLADTQPGDVVELGPGRYADEHFPLTVPAGVTLRGAGARATVIDAGGSTAIVLGAGARLELVTVTGGAPGYMMLPPTCVTGSGDGITIAECLVQSILLSGGNDHLVTNNVIAGGKVWCMGTNRVTVRGNYQHGLRWGAGIECNGGAGHVIEHNECRDDLSAIRCTATEGVEITSNRYETRWFGIHLLDARNTRVSRNNAWHTMRAVDVEGGSGNHVEKQLAEHCDSGIVVEGGAAATVLADSWLHDCRLGLLVWGAGDCAVRGIAVSAPRDHAVVSDQRLELDANQLDGDVWTR